MKEIITLILKLLEYFDKGVGEYKKHKRQKDIDKIKKDAQNAWNEKFAEEGEKE